jgi:hypothetical protein
MDKAEEKERERTREMAALLAFGAALFKHKGSNPPIKKIAKQAWEAGNMFLRVGFENALDNRLDRYEFALRELKGTEALRRIAELDGYKDDTIDWIVRRYADEADPVVAYAQDDEVSPKTFGQSMISLCLGLSD